MSKYGDMVALLDWAMKQKNSVPKKSKTFRRISTDDVDLVEMLRRKQKEAKMIEDFLKEHEKLNKKEEKKGGSGISIERLAMLLVATFPITGPLYYLWLTNVFRAAGLK